MGTFLVLAAIWIIICLGALDKNDKFLSTSTYAITAVFVVIGISDFFFPSSSSASGSKIAAQAGIGAIFGMVYVILYADDIRAKKRFPFAAGMAAVIIGAGWGLLFFGLAKWLNFS